MIRIGAELPETDAVDWLFNKGATAEFVAALGKRPQLESELSEA